jgi:hypothetical protein
MRRARGIVTQKVSISATAEDLAIMRTRAKRLHGGNISAVVHEMAAHVAKQDAIDRLWESLGSPIVSERDRANIMKEWLG